MNSLTIPAAPNWYENTVFACASDNTVIYGSRSDLVVIKPKDLREPAEVKIISRAHQDKIKSVAVSPAWQSKKLAATLGADKVVKLWNMEGYVLQLSHRGHTASSADVVAVTFAGNDRIVSVSVDGVIIIWRFGPNELVHLKDLLGVKPKVTSLSACPHSNWLIAFGMSNGLIIITDLRRNGKVLYKLRGHDEAILSFTWCPVQYNVLRKQETQNRKEETDSSVLETSDEKLETTREMESAESIDTSASNVPETITDFKTPSKNSNLWTNLKHADDEEDSYESSGSRPIPEHYDAGAEDCFSLEEFLAEPTSHSHFQDRPKKLKAKRNNYKSVQQKSKEQNCKKEEEFLAVCAALREQILAKKSSDDDCLIDAAEETHPDQMGSGEQVAVSSGIEQEKNLQNQNEQPATEPKQNQGSSDEVIGLAVESVLNVSDESNASDKPNKPAEAIKGEDEIEGKEFSEKVPDQEVVEPEKRHVSLEEISDDTADLAIKVEDLHIKSDRKEFLLASSSRAGNVICIWSISAVGRLQGELHLSGRTQKYKKRASDSYWITLLWIAPTILLSSSKQGELLSWDLKKFKGKGKDLKPSLVHNDHATLLFCMAAPVQLNQDEEDWRKDKELRVWTVGQDRYVLNTRLGSTREVCISYPTIGGPVQCLVQSPLDPNRVAIGIGDGTARVWDLSKPHLQCITMTRLWQKMGSKVLSLAWHPTKEAVLAYGTFEGRIGIADTLNPTKVPALMSHYSTKGVYQLQWGPLKGASHPGLYASCDGRVLIYDPDKPIEDPVIMPTPENSPVTQFTWNEDHSLLVLGAKSGALFFYTPDFQRLHASYHQQKAVQCLLWHPEAFGSPTGTHHGWLASSTNDNTFVVYDCSRLLAAAGGGDKEVAVVATLQGHSASVRCLAWSPHDGGKLVSVGEDSLAQVWDVPSKTIVASYLGHGTEGILAAIWSPLDADCVVTGGRDNTVRIWRVSECSPVQPEAVETGAGAKKKAARKSEKVAEERVEREPGKSKKILDSMSRLEDGINATLIHDCRRLFLGQQGKSEDVAGLDVLGVFKGKDDVMKLLECEEQNHLRVGKRQQAHHISLWKGDISETIKLAIANGTVSPLLISLAPMVSPKLWQEACEAYSKKLLESSRGDPLEISAYFLACHKVEEAIEALLTGGLYREALALAKARLGEGDPLVQTILERWALVCMCDGNFEIAAQCFIALGKLENAVMALFRRSDEVTLKLALDIAEHVNNEDLHKAVAVRYNAFKNEKREAEVEQENAAVPEASGQGETGKEN